MNDKQRTRASKFLSKHLRHEPASIGLTLESGGWVLVEDLLRGCHQAGIALTRTELEEIVAENNKQRFAFDETGTKIRANQGHSVEVDLNLEPVTPPNILYHGTTTRFLDEILRSGLQKMARHHVHLSVDIPTATNVGQRHGKPSLLVIDAHAMHQAGYRFYVSANGVWLTDEVPPAYLQRLEGPTT